ncbi:MAG: hypothetical protein K6F08_03435 [bacterium]|nr:hypothetical protein [bacterium]
MKIALKIFWGIIVTTVFILCFYFLFNGGFEDLISLSRDNGGFWGGFKQFWINLWEGFISIFS